MYKCNIRYNNENIELLWLDDFDIEHITGLVLQSQGSNQYSIKELLDMADFEYTVSQSVTSRNKTVPSLTVHYM